MFNVPQSEALLCVLARYDDDNFVSCVESDTTHGGAKCIRSAFDLCFETLKLKNGLAAPEESGSGTEGEEEGPSAVVEMFGSNAFRASNTLLSQDWALEPQRRVFWMGSLAWTGSWKGYPYRNGTLMSVATRQLSLREPYLRDRNTPDQCKISPVCSHYAKNLSVLSVNAPPQDVRGNGMFLRGQKYSPSSSAGAFSYDTGIEEVSCTPSVMVAGFMKSASSFLYQALTRHPNVLPALRGSQHKETQCYHFDRRHPAALLQRPWCFPFIEEGEQFVSVDGTVSYDIDQNVPLVLKEVNDIYLLCIDRNCPLNLVVSLIALQCKHEGYFRGAQPSRAPVL